MTQARTLYSQNESYALAMYSAGLAVECLLRAFTWDRSGEFDGRHNLERLFGASRILRLADEANQAVGLSESEMRSIGNELRGAMNTVAALWHNDFRFCSEQKVRSFLVSLHAYRGMRGDLLKAKALELLEAAQVLVDRGVGLWLSRKK